nr:probable cytochrome P450 49a1 [Procambarus clarkii]
MKTKTVAKYLPQVDQVAQDFITRCGGLRDDKNELPGEFMDELFKWALECEYWRPLLHHPGSFIMFTFYQLKYHF